jgi:hypothetical protein
MLITLAGASGFAQTVAVWLSDQGFRSRWAACSPTESQSLLLVRGPASLVVLHLLPTPASPDEVAPADASSAMTDAFAERASRRRERFGDDGLKQRRSKQTLVHLWEDQWLEHEEIVRSRLLAMLGRSRRLFARTTVARRIDSATCDDFLLDHHLWGATKSRYRFGLFTKTGDELVAVASFSARWRVRRHGSSEARASHELIRYCCRREEVVVGGISKLIAAFSADVKPDELVTVIDRDWGSGEGWRTLGFRPLKRLPPVTFYVGRDGRRCHLGVGPNPHRRRLPDEVRAMLEQRAAERSIERRASTSATVDDAEEDASGSADAVAAAPAETEETVAAADDERFLASLGYYPVRDAGAERHLLRITQQGRAGAPASRAASSSTS